MLELVVRHSSVIFKDDSFLGWRVSCAVSQTQITRIIFFYCTLKTEVSFTIFNASVWVTIGEEVGQSQMTDSPLISPVHLDSYITSYLFVQGSLITLWWRQYAPLKRRSTSIWLHSSISQKTLNFILATIRTWNVTWIWITLSVGTIAKKRSGSYF
jgi:hypothetical protein